MTDRTTTSQNLWTVTCPRRSLPPSLPHARSLAVALRPSGTHSLALSADAPSPSSPSCSSSPPAPFFSPSHHLVSRCHYCSNSPISSSSKRVKSQTSGSAPLRHPAPALNKPCSLSRADPSASSSACDATSPLPPPLGRPPPTDSDLASLLLKPFQLGSPDSSSASSSPRILTSLPLVSLTCRVAIPRPPSISSHPAACTIVRSSTPDPSTLHVPNDRNRHGFRRRSVTDS